MLAELAVRAGHDVVAFDRFGDLRPARAVRRTSRAPARWPRWSRRPSARRGRAVVYGAGLENRPDLVERLAAGRELLGCSPATLRRVRDPARSGLARAAGPPLSRARSYRPTRRRRRGAAGCASRCAAAAGAACATGAAARSGRRRACRSASRACRARSPRSRDGSAAVVLGVTEQLIGRPELGARGFAWCGNVAAAAAGGERRAPGRGRDLRARGGRLRAARRCSASTSCGTGERAWIVEVNPRPTGVARDLELDVRRSFDAHLDGLRRPAARAPPGAGARRRQGDRLRDRATPRSATRALAGTRDPRRAAPGRAHRRRPPDLHSAGRPAPTPGVGRSPSSTSARGDAARRAARSTPSPEPAPPAAAAAASCDDIERRRRRCSSCTRPARSATPGSPSASPRPPPLARIDGARRFGSTTRSTPRRRSCGRRARR